MKYLCLRNYVMAGNIVAILLTFALCPIPVMGQGFSNFVGNAKRIFTTDMDVQETTAKPLPVVRKERWCGFAKQYKAGGYDATVCYLSDENIHGNSHFMFEKNNTEIGRSCG